jgi:hypothetical protein
MCRLAYTLPAAVGYSGRGMRKGWLDRRVERFTTISYDELVNLLMLAFGILVVLLLILFTALAFATIVGAVVFDLFGLSSNPPGMGAD